MDLQNNNNKKKQEEKVEDIWVFDILFFFFLPVFKFKNNLFPENQ